MPVVIAEIPLRTLLIISVKGFGWRSMYGRKKETPSPDSKNEDVENIVQIVLDLDAGWCDVFFADGDCFRFASSVGEELLEQWGTVRHYNARSNTPLKQQPMNDPQRQVDFELP